MSSRNLIVREANASYSANRMLISREAFVALVIALSTGETRPLATLAWRSSIRFGSQSPTLQRLGWNSMGYKQRLFALRTAQKGLRRLN